MYLSESSYEKCVLDVNMVWPELKKKIHTQILNCANSLCALITRIQNVPGKTCCDSQWLNIAEIGQD